MSALARARGGGFVPGRAADEVACATAASAAVARTKQRGRGGACSV